MAFDTPAPTVTVAAVITAAGLVASRGVFVGEPIGTADSPTTIPVLLAPAGPAFFIWSVIYLGLFALTGWFWTTKGRASQRARSVMWPLATSMVLNATWIAVTVAGWLWAAVAVIIALLAVLVVLNRMLDRTVPRSTIENILLDGTCGLHAGWVSVATLANVLQAASTSGARTSGVAATVVAILLIAATVGWARLAIPRVRNFQSVLLGLLWGLAWIAVARLTGPLPSVPVAIAAGVAVLAIIILWIVRDRDVPAHLNRPARNNLA